MHILFFSRLPSLIITLKVARFIRLPCGSTPLSVFELTALQAVTSRGIGKYCRTQEHNMYCEIRNRLIENYLRICNC